MKALTTQSRANAESEIQTDTENKRFHSFLWHTTSFTFPKPIIVFQTVILEPLFCLYYASLVTEVTKSLI